jgi:hypothetical protein
MDIYGMIALASIVAIVVGVLFAGYELRLTRLQRRREAQMTLVRPFADPAFQAAMQAILTLPDGLDRAGVEARLGRDQRHLDVWLGTLETWGLFVHRGDLPLTLVGDIAGSAIVLSWQKLSACVYDVRAQTADPTLHIWYQWLAEHWSDRELRGPSVPAASDRTP